MVYAGPPQFLDPNVPIPMFAYLGLVEDIGYRDGREFQGRYEQAIIADTAIIDTSKPRLYWTDAEADCRQLVQVLKGSFQTLERSEPAFHQTVMGQGRYVAHVM